MQPSEMGLRSESSKSDLRDGYDKLGFSEVVWDAQNFQQLSPLILCYI